jgi:WD40 repeat protein
MKPARPIILSFTTGRLHQLGHTEWRTTQLPVDDPQTFGQDKDRIKMETDTEKKMIDNWESGVGAPIRFPPTSHPEESHKDSVYSIRQSGDYLVSSSRDGSVRIWDLHTQRLLGDPLLGHSGSVLCVDFDIEGELLVSGGADKNLMIWKFPAGDVLQIIENAHEETVLNLQLGSKYIVTCSKDKTIKLWDRNDYSMLRLFRGHTAAVNSVVFHKDEVEFMSGSGDASVRFWSTETGQCTKIIRGHDRGITDVLYFDTFVISASTDNTICIFESTTGEKVHCLEGHTDLVRSIKATAGLTLEGKYKIGSKIISGSYDGSIIVWKVDTEGNWVRSHTYDCTENMAKVFRVQFNARYLIFSGIASYILGWDFASI